MNRTDRLYALVEELRAVAPRTRTAAWLASRFEVSVRTVERDLGALREAGVPIWTETGRTGGYGLDRERTLPPLTLTPEEAIAITVALRSAAGSPFAGAAESAARKVLARLPSDVRDAEQHLAARLHRVGQPEPPAVRSGLILTALAARRVLRLSYVDAKGQETERDVEPLGLLWGPAGWYVLGWCRLRDAVRGFLLDRIRALALTGDRVERREVDLDAELARISARPLGE
ncbi:YafY family transcriptional regulator [Amycolatopsis sp. FU40]|uniref:helix-turn-helix transcriptional regulator n=1 Tax=Amycolatopsis sp. FU40 TaxID=2914159 RepID=UPI001F434179|nr:YafY family protein [Amycolatopsis sp. FU40]UKD56361.1 YafY family transcriptional regulator [Amycolatopsis sp. FU40]